MTYPFASPQSSDLPPFQLRGHSNTLRGLPKRDWDMEMGPARSLVRHVERRSRHLGHENSGFLSIDTGFVPRQDPRLQLDSRFAVWDQVAAELPSLYRSVAVRRTLEGLPVLDATPAHLPDGDVLRATALLAILAHAYWYCQPTPASDLPAAIRKPWSQLRARLGRQQEVVSYIDLVVYNWKRRVSTGPLTVENLQLLLPTIGNQEEQVFYLAQLEILASCAPIIRAALDAQDAVVFDDPEGLELALLQIARSMAQVVHTSLPKINPNPHSSTYVDAVTWAKTVAPFAVPIHKGDLGPSGTSSPIFNTLDIFFGRKDHKSFLGREIKLLRATYPPVWRAFLFALSRISVQDYVNLVDRPSLRDAFGEANEAYIGSDGFLGRHRMKVYGFLELAFKVGRAVTIGGFGGAFKDRTWDEVDDELCRSHRERHRPHQAGLAQARVVKVTPPEVTLGSIHQITLQVCGDRTVHYCAGDRIAIWPSHTDALVERTLSALGATGEEWLQPSAEWQQALAQRGLHTSRVQLRDVLRFGALRPVLPRVAEALHAASQNQWLLEQLQTGRVQNLELWQVLERLKQDGFAVRGLLEEAAYCPDSSPASGRAVGGRLCHILAPERPRLYSISSSPPSSPHGTRTIGLTVRQLVYPGENASGTELTGEMRLGSASTFLVSAQSTGATVPFEIRKSAAFQLPSNPLAPVILFAGGTGVSPFRSFIAQRLAQGATDNCLLLSLARSSELHYAKEWQDGVAQGRLHIEAGFTREGARLKYSPEQGLFTEPGPTRRIDDVLADPDVAEQLWRLLQPTLSRPGAHLYVCGRGGFATTVMAGLHALISEHATGTDAEKNQTARATIHRLVGEGRLLLEVHTDTQALDECEPYYRPSEVAQRNNDTFGYWVIIKRAVYDLTQFRELHPGGRRIVDAYAGMDATHGFIRAHDERPDVDAQLAMYRVGRVYTPSFSGEHAEVVTPTGIKQIDRAGAYRAWLSALNLCVEMENALCMDLSFSNQAVHPNTCPYEPTTYKTARTAETHHRFLATYLPVLELDTLPSLWRISQALFFSERGSEAPPSSAVDGDRPSHEHRLAAAAALVADSCSGMRSDAKNHVETVERLSNTDRSLLKQLKAALIAGVAFLESDETLVGSSTLHPLAESCRLARRAIDAYYSGLTELEPFLSVPLAEPAVRAALPGQDTALRLYTGRYWTLELDANAKLAFLVRTPVPIGGLSELEQENHALLRLLADDTRTYGLVVDTRHAPPRNDGMFEETMAFMRHGLTQHFERTAVLLASDLGQLQVTRLGRNDGHQVLATQSESSAVTYARGGR